MLFLKAITIDGETEYFNMKNILTIKPQGYNKTKILMGAGLYWMVESDTMEVVPMDDIFNNKTT